MLNVKNLYFKYKENYVLKDIHFSLKQGENLAIIGESGCGKSTLLKLIYGDYDLNKGEITWKNQPILGPKYNLVVGYDFIKQVTQEFDLMPYISVEENIGKFLSRFYPKEKQQRTQELINVVELRNFAKTKVKNLSGGQKQRVALARALAKQPELLLLDEPFSHIDNFKKQSLRRNIFKYLKSQNIACIVATHDKDDILGFANRMIVLDSKKIIAQGTPKNLYNNPGLPLIASFFDEYNIINNKIVYANQLAVVTKSDFEVTVIKTYFKGSYYLIETEQNNKTIFVKHKTNIEIGKKISLKLK